MICNDSAPLAMSVKNCRIRETYSRVDHDDSSRKDISLKNFTIIILAKNVCKQIQTQRCFTCKWVGFYAGPKPKPIG